MFLIEQKILLKRNEKKILIFVVGAFHLAIKKLTVQ